MIKFNRGRAEEDDVIPLWVVCIIRLNTQEGIVAKGVAVNVLLACKGKGRVNCVFLVGFMCVTLIVV